MNESLCYTPYNGYKRIIHLI